MTDPRTRLARFWANIDKREPDGCWLWTGRKNHAGYGAYQIDGVNLAHRVSWLLHHGEAPTLCVCHTCDTPACVNPAHLWLGTRQDNNRDMIEKGRQGQSRKTHCSKGHPFSAENTIWEGSRRKCRECARFYARQNSFKRRAAKGPRPPQTHCHRGHEFTPENTYPYKGRRICIACRQATSRAYRARAN